MKKLLASVMAMSIAATSVSALSIERNGDEVSYLTIDHLEVVNELDYPARIVLEALDPNTMQPLERNVIYKTSEEVVRLLPGMKSNIMFSFRPGMKQKVLMCARVEAVRAMQNGKIVTVPITNQIRACTRKEVLQ